MYCVHPTQASNLWKLLYPRRLLKLCPSRYSKKQALKSLTIFSESTRFSEYTAPYSLCMLLSYMGCGRSICSHSAEYCLFGPSLMVQVYLCAAIYYKLTWIYLRWISNNVVPFAVDTSWCQKQRRSPHV